MLYKIGDVVEVPVHVVGPGPVRRDEHVAGAQRHAHQDGQGLREIVSAAQPTKLPDDPPRDRAEEYDFHPDKKPVARGRDHGRSAPPRRFLRLSITEPSPAKPITGCTRETGIVPASPGRAWWPRAPDLRSPAGRSWRSSGRGRLAGPRRDRIHPGRTVHLPGCRQPQQPEDRRAMSVGRTGVPRIIDRRRPAIPAGEAEEPRPSRGRFLRPALSR